MALGSQEGLFRTPPVPERHSQQHQGGQQQEGPQGTSFPCQGLMFRLHAPSAVAAAAAAAETQPRTGHCQ